MSKITIIQLLNKIANGEGRIKKFRYHNVIWKLNILDYAYYNVFGKEFEDWFDDGLMNCLNEELEILDEEDEFEDIKSFGVHYSWDYIDYKNIEELKKYVNKDFQNIFDTLDKLIKNQKKIIERLKEK